MADEGFHEIQLNRKQLIFLFMSAAVVLVVAFLSGVLVGRGVGTQGAPDGTAVSLSAEAAPEESTAAVAPGPAPAVAPPQPIDEDLSYQARLEGKEAPRESLQPVPKETPAALPPKPPAVPPAKAVAEVPSAKVAAQSPADAKGTGWLVQVAALRGKSSAEAAAKRLVGKGYSAFVLPPPGPKGSRMYRVVVGRFKSRQEAEDVKRRLEKDRYTPWIIS